MEILLKSKRSSLLASLATQNTTLKIGLFALGLLVCVESTGLVTLAFKRPLIVAIENNQPRTIAATLDDDGISIPEFRAFVSDLLGRKFSKIPTVESQKQVCRFFSEGLKEACEKEASSKKLLIPQDYVLEEIEWDEKTEISHLKIKRYATFNGTISAVNLKLTLKIQKRRRTQENPWGLFVSEWKEEVQK